MLVGYGPDGERLWEVDALLDSAQRTGGLHYLVKWKNVENPSWTHYSDIPRPLRQAFKRQPQPTSGRAGREDCGSGGGEL